MKIKLSKTIPENRLVTYFLHKTQKVQKKSIIHSTAQNLKFQYSLNVTIKNMTTLDKVICELEVDTILIYKINKELSCSRILRQTTKISQNLRRFLTKV